MKKILKTILGVIGFTYLIFIIFITICLLNYNEYKVTEFGNKTFVLIDDKSDKFTDGDLVVFTKNNDEIKTDNEISFYEVVNGQSSVNIGTVTDIEKITEKETTFTINGSHKISGETVIGSLETAKVYHKVGKVLYAFESQYGFLLLVILPSLMLFFYAAYSFIMELKQPKELEETDEEDENEEEDTKGNEEPVNVPDKNDLPIKTRETIKDAPALKPRTEKSPIALKRPSSTSSDNED